VSARVFRVIALPAPSDRQKSQLYIQRFVEHFPAAGEIAIFDRSWYNRAGVERVMGFVDKNVCERFLELCPPVEREIVDSGIILIKFWLEVSMEEQDRRFAARIFDPLRQWKLSPMDLESYGRWYDYSRAATHAAIHRQQACSMVHRSLRRQAPRPTQLHRPHPEHDPIQENTPANSQAAKAFKARSL
jgi:polyphosphate kinase 2 (PPK2 family)